MLNPDNTTSHADPSSPSGEPAFGGASKVSGQPLTSGVETATSVIAIPTATSVGAGGGQGGGHGGGQGGGQGGGEPSATTPAGAAPMPTAAAGIAAILGVGAILINA